MRPYTLIVCGTGDTMSDKATRQELTASTFSLETTILK